MNNSIAFISVYYGRWPWYFKFFLKSCAYNVDVTFILVGDQKIEDHDEFLEIPPNVKIIHKGFADLKLQMEEKIGFPISLEYPYKLCDFKPTYGVVFEDLLKSYDFWGYCDIDIVFGNIRNFVTEDVLLNHDVITIRQDYLAGYFTIFKNKSHVNRLYESSKDYKLVFSSNEHYCFDECCFLFIQLSTGTSILELPSRIESMTHVVKKLQASGEVKPYLDHHAPDGNLGKLKWVKGSLIYKDEFEVILYHLIILKDLPHLIKPAWKSVPDEFYINSYSFGIKSPTSFGGLISSFLNGCSFLLNRLEVILRFHIVFIRSFLLKQSTKDLTDLNGKYISDDWILGVEAESSRLFLLFSSNEYHQSLIPDIGRLFHKIEFRKSGRHFINYKGNMLIQFPDKSKRNVQSFDFLILHKRKLSFYKYDHIKKVDSEKPVIE